MRLIIDAHLDLSWNALSFDRDQTQSIADLRRSEKHMKGKARGNCTVSLPEMRRSGVGVCLATVLARALPPGYSDLSAHPAHSNVSQRGKKEVLLREDLDFANQAIASATAVGQLEYYLLMERQGQMRMIRTRRDLDATWSQWEKAKDDPAKLAKLPIGYILSMEGADPIVDPDQAQTWWDRGLRTVCLAHYGPSAYAMGTGGDGPVTEPGHRLLKKLDELGMILDLVHTADTAVDQALAEFSGPVFVSHGNCRALVPSDRQMSDDQIRRIALRGGVLGVVLDNWMLVPGWKFEQTPREGATLSSVADHIDHICQVTGSCDHAGIGSDLDGGYGREQSPADLDTIADLPRLCEILSGRGYSDVQIDAVCHGNWLRFFRQSLPA